MVLQTVEPPPPMAEPPRIVPIQLQAEQARPTSFLPTPPALQSVARASLAVDVEKRAVEIDDGHGNGLCSNSVR